MNRERVKNLMRITVDLYLKNDITRGTAVLVLTDLGMPLSDINNELGPDPDWHYNPPERAWRD